MSAFDDEFAANLPELLAQFGAAVVYTSVATGAQATPTAILGTETAVEVDEGRGKRMVRRRKVRVPASVVARPRLRDTLATDGETWAVKSIDGSGGGLWDLTVEIASPLENTRPNYRANG